MPAPVTPGAPFCDDAVVLRSVAYGESDRIMTLLTRSHGKVSAMARAARRSQKRFGAALGLFVVGQATLRERRGAEMMTLESFDARHDYSSLGSDVLRLAHASYATELVRELTEPRHADPALFELLVELYAVVMAREPRADTLRAYELRLLDELGLRPVLDRCLACGDEGAALDAPGALIDPVRGGVVCAACSSRSSHDPQRRALPADARARLLLVRGLETLDEAALLAPASSAIQSAARQVTHALVAAHLRGPIRSLDFLEKLRQAGAGQVGP